MLGLIGSTGAGSGDGSLNLLGDDLLQYLVLALGGALLVGNVLALVKPPPAPKDGDLDRAPRGRSIGMALIGLVAVVWALATLLTG
ncbi:MAG TPA: hypothetical protein PLV68_00530 [Ilumatobacteraceae bacterium]|nr:hypothetical protein [Ilumatobacteraceae bacterium]